MLCTTDILAEVPDWVVLVTWKMSAPRQLLIMTMSSGCTVVLAVMKMLAEVETL